MVIRYRLLQAPGTVQEARYENVRIGTIPIMVGSSLCALRGRPARELGSCPFDQGGYFIVDGREKVVVAQERIAYNRLFITPAHDTERHVLEAQIQSVGEDDAFKKTVSFVVCTHQNTQHRNSVLVKIPDISEEVPVTMAFRALGVESDARILEYIGASEPGPVRDFLYYTLYDNKHNVYTQDDAVEHLRFHVRYGTTDHVRHIIANDFLRHTGPDLGAKALLLGRIVHRLVVTRLGSLPPDSRDRFTHKRLDTSGELVYQLFRDSYNMLRRHVRSKLEELYVGGGWAGRDDLREMLRPIDVPNVFDASIIDNMLKSSLKGNWALENDPEKAGIVQELNRVSFAGTQSHLRKTNTPMSRTIKLRQPRRLDPTQWGIACPLHSPDGPSIGLDKHLATLTHVTVDTPGAAMRQCLSDLGVTPSARASLRDLTSSGRVHLNDDLIGVHPSPAELATRIRLYRRNGLINAFTSVVVDAGGHDLRIYTHAGRLCRPLLVVDTERRQLLLEEAHLSGTWEQLFAGANTARRLADPGYVSAERMGLTDDELESRAAPLEFVDVEESFNTLVAMRPADIDARPLDRFTHCEIHPTTVLGMYVNSIPYANHNPAPRNVFSGAQGKQAIGVYATNFNERMDTDAYVLHYPQCPLVTTRYGVLTGSDRLPNGENLIVAIMSYTGYNQEDAVIVNRAALQRGMFNITHFKSFSESEVNEPARGRAIMFSNTHLLRDRAFQLRVQEANSHALDEHGMPRPGTRISEGDLMLGKLAVLTIDHGEGRRETRYVDQSRVADKTVEGIVDKVVVFKGEGGDRTARVRMREYRVPAVGDKVASRHSQKGVIGVVLPPEDMPFTAEGLVPDLIINPHAIPSRMTAAHLIECLVSKAGAAAAYRTDATAFEPVHLEDHLEALAARGMHRYGDEVLYSGFTGEQIRADVFIGPTFYFRLKHMVEDKINYRGRGPVATLTRQPVRGRAIEGGLRIGEMEKDVLLARGMTTFLREVYMDKSDGYGAVPYAFKLLTQELGSLGIALFQKKRAKNNGAHDNDAFF